MPLIVNPRPRIMGTEMEFLPEDISSKNPKIRFRLVNDPEFYQNPIPGVHGASTHNQRPGDFLTNGMYFYRDGKNAEACTPECLGIDQMTDYNLAARYLVERAITSRFETDDKGRIPIRLFGRLTDYSEAGMIEHGTKGFHENYYVYTGAENTDERNRIRERQALAIAPFLVGRTVINGAGEISTQNGRVVVQTAQKAPRISSIYGPSSHGPKAKPVIAHRNTDLNSKNSANPNYIRQQVMIGDFNTNRWASWMTFGTTSAIFRLIENGIEPDIRLYDSVANNDAVRSVHKAGKDHDGSALIDLIRNGVLYQATPTNLFEMYFEAAANRIEDGVFSDDELQIFPHWETAISELYDNPFRLADAVDHIAIRERLDGRLNSRPLSIAQRDEMLYSMITGFPRKYRWGWDRLEKGEGRKPVKFDDIEHAIHNPPMDSRAWHRSSAIEAVSKADDPDQRFEVNWVRLFYKCSKSGKEFLAFLEDPHGNLDPATAEKLGEMYAFAA